MKYNYILKISLNDSSNANRMKGIRQIFGGPLLRGPDKILLLGEALKFGEIFKNLH